MTFHDKIFEGFEIQAYDSVYNLQLWLNTIAGVDSNISLKVLDSLLELCNHLKWKTEYEDQLGTNILVKRGTKVESPRYEYINRNDVEVFLYENPSVDYFINEVLLKEIYKRFSDVEIITIEIFEDDKLYIRINFNKEKDMDIAFKEYNAFWYDWFYENSELFRDKILIGII